MSDFKAFYKYLSVFGGFDMLLSVFTHVNSLCENRWLLNTALSRCYSCLFSTFMFCLFKYFFSLWGENTASFSKLRKCILVVSYPAWNWSTGMCFQVPGFEERRCGCCSFSSNQFLPNQYQVNALERWVGTHTANPNALICFFFFLSEAMSAKTMDLFLTTKLQLIIGLLILRVLLITLEMRNQCLQWIVW